MTTGKQQFKRELSDYMNSYLSFYEEYDNANEAFLDARSQIAKSCDLSVDDVEIEWHPVVGEWCIYIKGKWNGYYEPEIEGEA